MTASAEALTGLDAKQRLNRVRDALFAAQQDGMSTLSGVLTPGTLDAMLLEAESVPNWLRRRIHDWEGVDRATFIPGNPSGAKDVALMVLFYSGLFVPTAHRVAKILAADVRAAGMLSRQGTLAEFYENRIGFNYMHGSAQHPSLVPDHTDVVKEHGLVMAINLDNSARDGKRGDIHLLLSSDTCHALGIPQPVHSVIARAERVGMTIADLRP